MYLLCCKSGLRSRFQSRSRTHPPSYDQEHSLNTDRNQQQAQLNSQRSFSEPPPSYQEANRNNVNLNKYT
jgi:hypothetical protein